jgi:hypothetical protein
MFKILSVSLISATVALAAIPQQANAGGRGIALGVGLGLGAAALMHSAHKSRRASQRRAITRRRAAQRHAAARRKALARKKQAAYARKAAIARKKKQARVAAIAAKKRQAAKQVAIAKQRRLARQAEANLENEQELAANIELPGKKPATKTFNVAEADIAEYDYELDTYSTNDEPVQKLDCKRFIPSAGLTITVPCGE